MRAALLQTNASCDPAENLEEIESLLARAVEGGAGFALTPETCNCMSSSLELKREILHPEESDPTLAVLRRRAREAGIWLLIGSLALKTEDADGRFANRSFLIAPDGEIACRYDKIHMFDVEISKEETYRESKAYRPGERAALARTPFAAIGLTVCYDVRFPELHRRLAQAGAQVLTVPAAFSPVTGEAHWETLLRARAIETGCYVLAPAQTGRHRDSRGRGRSTHGHSLAIGPWGEILADAGTETGVAFADLDMGRVEEARRRVPSLSHGAEVEGP